MSGGIGGVPSVRGRFFKDIMEKKIRDPLIAKVEASKTQDSTAMAAAEELLKKKKKSALENGSLTGTTGSSGYSILKETLG